MKTAQKTETYLELKKRQSDEHNQFPVHFAFSNEQLEDALLKLNAKLEDCISVGSGSILRKVDLQSLKEMGRRHRAEMQANIKDDNFLIGAIDYELANHEYGYTLDPHDTIQCLNLDMGNERIRRCFEQAKRQYMESESDNF